MGSFCFTLCVFVFVNLCLISVQSLAKASYGAPRQSAPSRARRGSPRQT